jgi:glycosyltransferase involved in cell wall biosynthesis
MSPNPKPRILMELRTCFERFAGIPQETRLLFSAFLDMPELAVEGLINHTGRRLGRALEPGKVYDAGNVHERHDRLSKFIVSTLTQRSGNAFSRWLADLRRDMAPTEMAITTQFGRTLKMYQFDATDYPDFAWETFFSATLPSEEIGKIASARYRTLAPSWRSMHRAGLIGGLNLSRYPTLDTSGYDIVMVQTPYPARLTPGSQLLVRYHDAIPIYLPHTIPTAPFHRKSHYRALLDNAPGAIFGCTSQAARSDLLNLFPKLESRTPVIHDVVSHNYYPEPISPEAASEIIRSRVNAHSEPGWKSPTDKAKFYDKQLLAEPLRYILMVSSIEPRKNHLRLLRAWERMRVKDPELKLVIVGSLGWEFDSIVEAFKPWQERGLLFHLSGVPTNDLRQLYSSAECVVCPSLAEGFDLSGVEAMMCGSVVAASDIAVHREVYGEAAHYFDRYSVPALADTVANLIDSNNAGQRAALRTHGLQHAKQYSREVIAPQWAELFARIHAGAYRA